MKQILFSFIMIVVLGSCIVKPYKAQTVEQLRLDSLYRYATDTSNNVSQIAWRDFFVDVPLQRLIDTVLVSNFDYRIALLRVEQSYANVRSARAMIAPSVGGALAFGTTNVGGASLSASWEVDIWGKLYANKEAVRSSFWQSEQTAIAVRQSLIAAVANSYYELIAMQAKRKVILETIENRTQYLATTRLLKEAGKVNEIAVQQAISQLAEVEAALPQMEMAIGKVENLLAFLAGRDVISIEIPKEFDLSKADIQVSAGYPAQLLAFRPDVRAAEQNFRSKHYLHMVARAALYPSFTISAEAGLVNLFYAPSIIRSVLAGLTAPIFNGRRLRSAKEIADAEAKIADIEFHGALFTAVREVNDAMISVSSSDSRTKAQVVQLAALKKAYQYSQELFINGYATYLDVLVAQTGVYNAQMGLIDTFLASLTSRITLYRALGGGSDDAQVLPDKICDHDALIKNSDSKKLPSTKKNKKTKNIQ